jgi:hypothetical protein
LKLSSEGLVFKRGEALVGRATEIDRVFFLDKLEAHCLAKSSWEVIHGRERITPAVVGGTQDRAKTPN